MKATFVSTMPRPIMEHMPHIRPTRYQLAAAKERDFEILLIEDGIDSVYKGEGEHINRIELGEAIAENLRQMICNSQISLGEDACPGVFWILGDVGKKEIIEKHSDKLQKARFQQLNWFRNLCREADDVWAKFHQHRGISDLMRDAGRIIGLKNREWMASAQDLEFSTCPACGSNLPSPEVTKCATCLTIIKPEEHAKKFNVKVA